MVAKPITEAQGPRVVAHAREGLHLLRDGFFGAWAHVHLGEENSGRDRQRDIHLACGRSLAEALSAIPAQARGEAMLAHARLAGTLAEAAQKGLIQPATLGPGQLGPLPGSELQSLLGQLDEAAENLSSLSADLAEVLMAPAAQMADQVTRDRATQATLASILIHEHLRNLSALVSERLDRSAPERPGRNQAYSCGSGRKYKHCCGAQPETSSHARGR